jgi:hypothetical protein
VEFTSDARITYSVLEHIGLFRPLKHPRDLLNLEWLWQRAIGLARKAPTLVMPPLEVGYVDENGLGVVQKQRRTFQAFLRRKRVGKYKVIFERSLSVIYLRSFYSGVFRPRVPKSAEIFPRSQFHNAEFGQSSSKNWQLVV